MMMPPVTTMMVPMMIVVTMASLGEIGLSALPITQPILALAIKSVPVRGKIARPIPFMRFPVTRGEDVTFGRAALVKEVRRA